MTARAYGQYPVTLPLICLVSVASLCAIYAWRKNNINNTAAAASGNNDDAARKVAKERLGLVVLYAGQSPDVDIVAVHGLGASPERAWVRTVSVSGNVKGVNWLKDEDMLPVEIPSARIMTFNYESKWSVDAPQQRRTGCARQLLEALRNRRNEEKDTKYRPLIFIGHSFGGIVIEEALVSANSDRELQHISLSTVGIVFLGTPHRGAPASKWARRLAASGNWLGFSTEERILMDLREDSEPLQDLLYPFSRWLFRYSIPIQCFFEQHKTNCAARFGNYLSWKELVVDERSACIDGHPKLGLPTNHLMINKYQGPEDIVYKYVYPKIVEMAADAVGKVRDRLSPNKIIKTSSCFKEKEDRECIQALLVSDPLDDLERIKTTKDSLLEGTGAWILSDPSFTKWTNDDRSHRLWIHGDPGKGKTMLTIALVAELSSRLEKSRRSDAVLAYFFCDDKDSNRNDTVSILRGLVYQVICQRPDLLVHLRDVYDREKEKMFVSSNALWTLWRILQNMLKHSNLPSVFYFVVDGLDECEEDSLKDFLKLVAPDSDDENRSSHSSSACKAKWLLTSRNEDAIKERLRKPLDISLERNSPQVARAVKEFVDVKVERLASSKDYDHELKNFVKERLCQKAEGTFLWVALACRELDDTSSIAAKKALEQLPSGLDSLYKRMLEKVRNNKHLVEYAIEILRAVSICVRSLTLEELGVVAGLPKHHCNDLKALEIYTKQCGSFLTVRGGTVHFVHQSAKDYLQSDATIFSPGRANENKAIATRCFQYICSGASHEDFSKSPKYPVLHWMEHGRAASPDIADNFDLNTEFFQRDSKLRQAWFDVYWKETYPHRPREPSLTLLHIAAYAGLSWLVAKLLSGGHEVDINTADLILYTPLHWAAENGHEAAAKVLLDTGKVDLDSKAGNGQTPLSLAAYMGHEAVVKLLLDTGKVDLNSKDYVDETPLSLAVSNGRGAVAKLLLDTGKVDVDSKDYIGQTPLARAAHIGHQAMTKLLLDTGKADVDSKADDGQTPLSLAAYMGHEAVVKLLLDTGKADVNSKARNGQTPLSWAAGNGHEAVVKLLLDTRKVGVESKDCTGQIPLSWAAHIGHGAMAQLLLDIGNADVDSKANDGQTPLSWAVRNGHEPVVKLLLETRKVDLDSKDNSGQTPLSRAADNGHEAIVKLLLDTRKVDVDSKAYDGRTPLSWATRSGHAAIVKLLLDTGKVNVDSKDSYGTTPLLLAVALGHEAVVKLLLDTGKVDVGCEDNNGRTPLFLATFLGRKAVVELLESYSLAQ
ncbi:MAG: hypothetical protein M1839_007868 [Geoglossum umbratile]|nr:MAG: hypothetical protein M1839_007868 [Geoglossum umbratile]